MPSLKENGGGEARVARGFSQKRMCYRSLHEVYRDGEQRCNIA